MIFIPGDLKRFIEGEGEKAYPNECCGIIYGNFGDTKKALSAEAIVNSSEDAEQYHRFLITPEDMLQAELKAQRLKLDVLGFYHSHPDCPAVPSDYDREHALPFYSYVIVSVEKGVAQGLASWELAEDRGIFNKEEIKGENSGGNNFDTNRP